MTLLFLLVAGIGLKMIQTAADLVLPQWLGTPDLIFLLVIHACLQSSFFQAAIAVYCLGVMMDATTSAVAGVYPVLYLTIILLHRFFLPEVMGREYAGKAYLAALLYLVSSGGIFLFGQVVAPEQIMPVWSWHEIFRQFVLLLLVSPILFRMLDSLQHHLTVKIQALGIFHRADGNRFRS